MTAEQLEASRAERLRQNGHGALTFEDARTWIEETGLCLFLPRRQFSSSIAPSFVEAVAGHQNATPDPKHIQLAEELLVRLELEDIAVRLNLLGQPGEQPDFVVASWVLPYVYALRGDRDWRRSPQLTGSRQVSQLAVQTYKLLEAGDTNLADLTHALGREVTETAVLRAITELWQQLRIIPVIAAPGVSAKWQLLRHRFQKAIAEGASTSQVTAISVLASIYLQAVITASMEEVEMFLAPLTARSKVREVLRGLVATRQVHTISMGHSPQFYVAGTLPEFSVAPSLYSSSSMAGSYFLRNHDHDDDVAEVEPAKPIYHKPSYATPAAPVEHTVSLHAAAETPAPHAAPAHSAPAHIPAHVPAAHQPAAHAAPVHKPVSNGKPAAARPHFSRPAAHSRDRKPAQSSSGSRAASGNRTAARPARRPAADSRTGAVRPAAARPTARPSAARPATGSRPASGSRPATGARPAPGARWSANAPANGAKAKLNGKSAGNGSNGTHGNGTHGNGTHARTNGASARPASGASSARNGKAAAPAWNQRGHANNGHSSNGNGSKPAAKSGTASARSGSVSRSASAPRKDSRTDARPAARTPSRKPALAAGTKAGNSKRYGFTARPKQETKKRG